MHWLPTIYDLIYLIYDCLHDHDIMNKLAKCSYSVCFLLSIYLSGLSDQIYIFRDT